MREGNKKTFLRRISFIPAYDNYIIDRKDQKRSMALFQRTCMDKQCSCETWLPRGRMPCARRIRCCKSHYRNDRSGMVGPIKTERNGNKRRRTAALIFTTSSGNSIRMWMEEHDICAGARINRVFAAEDVSIRKMKIHRSPGAGDKLSIRQFPVWKLMTLFARAVLVRPCYERKYEVFLSTSGRSFRKFSDLTRHTLEIFAQNRHNIA